MASELHKRPGSRSPPPAWQRLSYPPTAATTTSASAHNPPSSRPDSHQADAPLHAIPAPKYLDLAPVKSEKDILDARPQSTSTSTTPTPSLTGSMSMYGHLGPPPPYSSCYPTQPTSAPTTAPSAHNAQTAYASPPGSRRESREDQAQEPQRLHLPSISEALKLPQFSAPISQHQSPTVPAPPPFPHTTSLNDSTQSISGSSPTIPRSQLDSHHPSSLSSFSSQHSPHNAKPPEPTSQRPYALGITESPRQSAFQPYSSQAASPSTIQAPRYSPALGGPTTSATSQHFTSTPAPPPPSGSYSRTVYPSVTNPTTQPPASQPTQHSTYRPLQHPSSGFSFPPPQTSGLTYEQQMNMGAQQQHHWAMNAELEKVEEQRRAAAAAHAKRGNPSGSGYGLTVKRHLDDFDLENSLNEIAERTHMVMEFSRTYSYEANKYGRSPVPVSQCPPTEKVAEMINQSLAITDALHRLKSTIEEMNIVAAEERARQQHQSVLSKPGIHPGYGPEVGAHPGYDMHARGMDHKDMPPGVDFNGDAKKPRRGRNAPPGRCHSCNRAETPEWRRGPDGARTLCNACGLHYAKLTRKMGAKQGQSGGSSLRPKEGDDATA